jgi:hypothetical protein
MSDDLEPLTTDVRAIRLPAEFLRDMPGGLARALVQQARDSIVASGHGYLEWWDHSTEELVLEVVWR